ncbi:zinc-dependent peptidase [Rhodopirellula sp. JC740]|uniref:Zinc-dependent peptidase n=1 Tax=Rhodopirellula halodulae TaxID=2894198 RepID=A0ABS8NHV5_9BACT|nr:zinc-dependent peptidase [Rhodopirellula sp. JC740]MCC9642502.1 zinc-dependent peptidase [Rhodopirellula sp. JC740]
MDRSNRRLAFAISFAVGALIIGFAFLQPWTLLALPIAWGVHWFVRRKTKQRLQVIATPFPEVWESALQQYVEYYRMLAEDRRIDFQNRMKVFLDEVTLTGIRTDVDETTRALVGASAVIPIMGLDDFEYSGLGEVLIYPGSFGEDYQTEGEGDKNTLGMIGVAHLSGVMILSKPSLLAGFSNSGDKRNVGIHEFAHLVDKADGDVDGIPVSATAEVTEPWVKWVGEELRSEGTRSGIDDYAYTNEAEYFAVLSEYFFEKPAQLQTKDPQLYNMLRKMYHQDPKRLFSKRPRRKGRVQRNDPCPCDSGKKFKHCCRRKRMRGMPGKK